MVPEVASKLSAIADACQSAGVDRLWLFGSALGRSDSRPFDAESDIDFFVDIDREVVPLRGWTADPFWRLWGALEDIFRPRDIQIVEAAFLKNEALRGAIMSTRELIYDRTRAKAAG